MVAYLEDKGIGGRLERWVDWPEPLKFVVFKKGVKAEIEVAREEGVVWVSADAPVKGVVLAVLVGEGGEVAVWEDKFVGSVPGETVRIGVKGLEGCVIGSRKRDLSSERGRMKEIEN